MPFSFSVACSLSTIDLGVPDGQPIPIEKRAPEKVAGYRGIQWAPKGGVRSPAFDVTPAGLVTVLITEKDVIEYPSSERVAALLRPTDHDEADLLMRPALFLDRDGVINVEKNYLHRREDFEFVDGIFELCESAAREGMALVVVTNQAGIGRGYYTEAQFHELTDWMRARFAERGIALDAVYFCPFHPQHGIGEYKTESFDRKPNPGMILRASQDLGLDCARSVLVGDKPSDIAAAKAAGVGRTILLADGDAPCTPVPDKVVRSLPELRAYLFGAPA